MMLSPGEADLDRFCGLHFTVPERMLPSEWCERHLVLPSGASETEPGRLRFDQSPYLREPLDSACGAFPGVRETLFSGPTRIGKTLIIRCGIAYSIAGDPGPMLLVDSTMDKGRSLVRKEIKPLIAANPLLAARRPANRHHFSDGEMLFPGAPLNIFGANSEAQVSGDTVRRVFGNEVGKWRGATDDEAAILELVRHRTESFDDERGHLFSSTPTTEDDLFWLEMQKGDLRVFYVRCPACGTLQHLVWAHVVWTPDARRGDTDQWDLHAVRASARYSCENSACPHHDPGGTLGTGWDDDTRLRAICDPASHWRPTQSAHPGYRSYHLNGLYGRRKANRLGELAVDFLAARQGPFLADRQDFWNSRMGMPWKESTVELTAQRLAHLEAPYERGTLPAGFRPDCVILGFDVQTYGFPWIVRAFSWSGESYLIDHGLAPAWSDLDAVESSYARHGAWFAIGDINFEDRRGEVLEQIWRRSSRRWFAADGVEFSRERVRVEQANVFMGGKLQGERQSIEAEADLGHERGVVFRQRKIGLGGACAFHK